MNRRDFFKVVDSGLQGSSLHGGAEQFNMTLQPRRQFLKAIGLGAAAIAFPKLSHAMGKWPHHQKIAKKPNIILIMADDMGYESLSCYGSASYKTPVLDNLAETGVKFNDCHAQPLCTPSRVKIMTGKYNLHNYEQFNYLNPKETTFANILRDAGYATCLAGKWQLNAASHDPKIPYNFGFDEHCLWQLFSFPVPERGYRYADPTLYKNGEKHEHEGKYGPDICCDFIMDFIERKKSEPFLVYYPMILPHDPFVPTPDSPEWSDDEDQTETFYNQLKKYRHKPSTKYYKDMTEYTDKTVGRILKKLDELGIRDNTLILFTGDNGTHFSITSKMKDGRTIQGGKGYTTDNGTHVPLIASWKGSGAVGKVCEDLIGLDDFLPTIAEAAGAKIPEDIDGRSFLPQILGKKGNPRGWLFMYANPKHPWVRIWDESPEQIEPDSLAGGPKNYIKRFVRDKRWKLYSTGCLYDLKNDIIEKKPIRPEKDTEESAKARKHLKEILESIK